MNDENKEESMHKNFFDRAKEAREAGFYLEAVFLEYAAIEGRLEVLCGLFGCPCNKDLDPSKRKSINISQRVNCLMKIYKNHPASIDRKTMLDNIYWKNLQSWIKNRNIYVHGLYKRAEEYAPRGYVAQELAEQGYEYTRLLYNEVKRIRRLYHNHPEEMAYSGQVCRGKCSFLNILD